MTLMRGLAIVAGASALSTFVAANGCAYVTTRGALEFANTSFGNPCSYAQDMRRETSLDPFLPLRYVAINDFMEKNCRE